MLAECSCLFYGSQWGVAALNDLVYGRCMHLTTLAATTTATTTRELELARILAVLAEKLKTLLKCSNICRFIAR